ncbi:uncharacterized protein LOC132888274 [Neoarius graeffei]|uniref:uncharacterized protein LOC132888274 n=1 Tax=Neoarius graeffei TaxID=443677 RepID=UPI00298D5FF5|nr:uncharacterized protein LOC132888274 [Neoarius graeffei]
MDLCNRYGVHGQCCLVVVGVDEISTEEMIISFFEQNGKISKCIRIPDEPGQPNGRALIVYASETSITKINPDTLGHIPSPNDPAILWHVRTIRDICQEDLGKELAHQYLEELSAIGGSATSGYASILERELRRIQSQASEKTLSGPSPRCSPMPHTENGMNVEAAHSMGSQCNSRPPSVLPSSNHSTVHSPLSLGSDVLNPPSVQRVIVEHVIRNDSAPLYTGQSKVRTFSGRLPKPNGEVDYDAWKSQVELLLSDAHVTDSQKVRKILESLVGPAADMVKPLGITSVPHAYVNQLESAFGVVEDGEELFAKFLNASQNAGEKPSDYLFRLQTLLTKVVLEGESFLKSQTDSYSGSFAEGAGTTPYSLDSS